MLSDQILKTLKYFDVQDHCLTLLEIHKYLFKGEQSKQYSLSEIEAVLNNELKEKVKSKSGFFFLINREELVEKRLSNNYYATPRLKKASSYLKYIRHIPYIRAVALTGSEALNNSKDGSDIDLLVLTKPGRIWLGRIFLTAYFHFLGVRRHGNKVQNRFCLNHYIEAGKEITQDKNIYTAVEYVSLVPYFGAEQILEFQKSNLAWIKQYLHQPQIVKYEKPIGSTFQKSIESIFNNPIGDFLEKKAAQLQKKRIIAQEHIVIESDELSFHPDSKGQQILKRSGNV